MTPNGPKVRESLLHVIWQAERLRKNLTQFDILKTLFIADRSHLNKYGRPITFDEYVAMPDGPVPSLAYDVLKQNLGACTKVGIVGALWTVEATHGKKKYYTEAVRNASGEVLSESDFEELDNALKLVKKLGYQGTWDKTHADPAYKEAWAKRGNSKQHPMDYALLFNTPNKKAAEELKFTAAHI